MRYIYFLPALLFCVSCGENEAEATDQDDTIGLNDSVPELTDSLFVEMEDTLENEVFLEEIPAKWTMLTDETGTGDPLVIYNWCGIGTPSFEFIPQKGEDWRLQLMYGQDGEDCEITFFEAFIEEQELMEVVSGTFRYKSAYDESTRFCDFWWNKDTHLGHFEGMGMQSSWFVAAENAEHFEKIDEACDDI